MSSLLTGLHAVVLFIAEVAAMEVGRRRVQLLSAI